MAKVYKLGGRIFAPAEQLTARQDGFLRAQISDTGLVEILSRGLASGEEQQIAQRLIVEAYRTGTLFHVVAAWLAETGTKWTVKDANANAEFFGDLTDEEDKSQLALIFAEAITNFFTRVVLSLTRTRTSSASPDATASPRESADNSTSIKVEDAGPSVPDSSLAETATA